MTYLFDFCLENVFYILEIPTSVTQIWSYLQSLRSPSIFSNSKNNNFNHIDKYV